MLKKLKSLRSQRGDTILEVLIATAVLTLILTMAYTAANRGSLSTRQAQERGEASRHTEAQIELLKAFISRTSDPALPGLPPASGGYFCMVNGNTPVIISNAPPDDAQQEVGEQFEAFEDEELADCKKDELYHSYIKRDGNTFVAHTRWNKVNGKGIDEATMVHRVFPDLASAPSDIGTGSGGCSVYEFPSALGGCLPCPTGETYVAGSGGGLIDDCQPIDTDGDGVPDINDNCPGTVGPPSNSGCPPDTDGDGVLDSNDNCPGTPPGTPVNASGCPDTDGDGVVDSADQCKTRHNGNPGGPVNGCPLRPLSYDLLCSGYVGFVTNASSCPNGSPVGNDGDYRYQARDAVNIPCSGSVYGGEFYPVQRTCPGGTVRVGN